MSGRVALVTGATGGLGLAAATALAQRNADIWIVGRDPQRIEAARRAIAGVAPDSSVTTAVADSRSSTTCGTSPTTCGGRHRGSTC